MRDCPVCQLRSVLNRQIKTHRFTTASYTPMEDLRIDTIGLVVSKNSADNCYILVIIDCFTRFVKLYPVSDTSALFLYPVIPAKRDDNLDKPTNKHFEGK